MNTTKMTGTGSCYNNNNDYYNKKLAALATFRVNSSLPQFIREIICACALRSSMRSPLN